MRNPGLKRRIPSPKDIFQLLRFRKIILRRTDRLLSKAFTIYDLRDIAKKRTPQGPFDYTDGGADQELSLKRSRDAFQNIEFSPSILRDVSEVDLSQEVLGRKVSLPVGIAPTGFTRMMHSEGEIAGAMSAESLGIPFTLSTMGTRSIEEVAAAAPNGWNWFQLYMWKDREDRKSVV
jgi:isopentenyl diphosphate isomerase/L-lactate dehydrogenase-like FMN-dependent dehydrogenase